MASFIDSFSYLPQTVDIGGDIYFLGPERHINLGFKSRKQFLDTFGTNSETEGLLRKYMNLSVTGKNKLVFDSVEDKTDLINILKKRATVLKNSNGFTSSTLKNEIFKRSYLYIQKLITELEGSNGKSIKVDDEACIKAKKEIKTISDDHKFQMILEMAWYLLHPDKVPSEIGCDWAKLVKNLERLRVGDIFQSIRDAEPASEPRKNALNYFKKINLETVLKKDTIRNALDQAKVFATEIQSETASESIKKRLKLLLDILEMKKYLASNLKIDQDRMKIISTSEERNIIQKSIMENPNPMKGGALAIPLGKAMMPLFDYFKVVYDPIYSFLETSIIKYKKTNQIIIPQLTTLLHICNNLQPDTYGVYRITNVDKELLSFIKFMISITVEYIGKFADPVDKNTFDKQVFKLPKVHLSSISDVAFYNKTYKDPIKLPSIQFFVMNANIKYLPNPIPNEDINTAVKEFYTNDNIYMVYTKSDNISEQIPINVHEIDYSKVDVSNTTKIDNLTNNYFNVNKDKLAETFFEKLLDITPYAVYNDAELALSIFIAFKELMPK
jgi:hypothetical protein